METSAKDATNVEKAFNMLIKEVYKANAKPIGKAPTNKVTKLEKGKKLDVDDNEVEEQTKPIRGVRLSQKRKKNHKSNCC